MSRFKQEVTLHDGGLTYKTIRVNKELYDVFSSYTDLLKANYHAGTKNPNYVYKYKAVINEFKNALGKFEIANLYVSFAMDREELVLDSSFLSDHVEMFISISTCDSAPFTSHMGITRSESYIGEKHKALSPKLHSFAAKSMLSLSDTKLYMITTPVPIMGKILLEEFVKRGYEDSAFLGGNMNKYFPRDYRYEEIVQEIDRRCSGKNALETSRSAFSLESCYLKKIFHKQRESDRFCPIKAEGKDAARSPIFLRDIDKISIYKPDGTKAITITQEMLKGEYAWFCSPIIELGAIMPEPGISFCAEFLTTLNLEKLATIGDLDFSSIEVVGALRSESDSEDRAAEGGASASASAPSLDAEDISSLGEASMIDLSSASAHA